MNRAFIDTDILTYFLKGDPDVVKNLKNYLDYYNVLEINLITYCEILSGLSAKDAYRQLSVFEDFVSENIILPLTEKSAKISAEIYSILRKSGNSLDDIDLLIARIDLENDMTLITNNVKHFSRIPGFRIHDLMKLFVNMFTGIMHVLKLRSGAKGKSSRAIHSGEKQVVFVIITFYYRASPYPCKRSALSG